MDLVKVVKKEMIDEGIEEAKELAIKANISYFKVKGFLDGSENIKLCDLKAVLDCLNLNVKFIKRGEQ